ncbi:MAG: type II toxin-antitoxin system VapB family antitoxin [Verrucomicrobiota bacterium]
MTYAYFYKKFLTIWALCHTKYGMKMTMHIDDDLLARVMSVTGAESKTKAIDLALREMDRRAKLTELASAGLGLTASELRESFDPASYPESPFILAEKPVNYGRKPRSRR